MIISSSYHQGGNWDQMLRWGQPVQDFSAPSWLVTLLSCGATLQARYKFITSNKWEVTSSKWQVTSDIGLLWSHPADKLQEHFWTKIFAQFAFVKIPKQAYSADTLFTQFMSSWSLQILKHMQPWQTTMMRKATLLIFHVLHTFCKWHYAVQALAEKEVDLGDSAPYFLDSAERLAQPGFLPSDEDILR